MRQWSYYRLSDGLFIGRRRMTSDAEAAARETPEGCAVIEGYYDRWRYRVDIATGAVVADESLLAGRAQWMK